MQGKTSTHIFLVVFFKIIETKQACLKSYYSKDSRSLIICVAKKVRDIFITEWNVQRVLIQSIILWCNDKVYSITINCVELKLVHSLGQKKHAQYNSRIE